MLIVLQQLCILYAFLCLGYYFGKKKPGLRDQTGILSFLLVNLFLPSKTFSNFAKNFTVSYIQNNYQIIILSVSLLIVLHFLAKYMARGLEKDEYNRKVYEYSITISNYAYMGYTLVEGVFGAQMLTNLILFCIPFSIYTYTVGYMKLTGSGRDLKRLVNPITGAIVLGVTIGLTGLPVPSVLEKALSMSSACVGPVSMLLTGFTLSAFCIRELFAAKKVYALVGIRLVVIPLIVFVLFTLFRLQAMMPCALIMAAMPTGLNTIVFPKSVGKSSDLGARLAFLSHLFSCATIPIWLSILM